MHRFKYHNNLYCETLERLSERCRMTNQPFRLHMVAMALVCLGNLGDEQADLDLADLAADHSDLLRWVRAVPKKHRSHEPSAPPKKKTPVRRAVRQQASPYEKTSRSARSVQLIKCLRQTQKFFTKNPRASWSDAYTHCAGGEYKDHRSFNAAMCQIATKLGEKVR